jgi:G3E family GTPase
MLNEVFPDEKKVLIENEYGEIGIDGSFLKDAGVEITELNSGCICCTLVGDFTEALEKVIDQFAPDRIIIEPSGVGKLSDIVRAVEKVKQHEDIAVTEKIAVVDAKKAKIYYKNFGEFFRDQVHYASTIVLSRTQMITPEKLAETVALLRTENPDAPMITTPWDELDREAVLHAFRKSDVDSLIPEPEDDDDECDDPECECHHHHHDDDDDDDDDEEHEHHHHHHHHGHDADEVFSSCGFETAGKFERRFIEACLDRLDSGDFGAVLRCKGVLPSVDGTWIHFDYVPGEKDVRTGSADVTGKLCVIGSNIDKKSLRELFNL